MVLGRTIELNYLSQYFEKKENSLVVLYGQRGVGVSTVWKEFVGSKPVFVLSAVPCSEREQLFLWSKELRSQGIDIQEYPDFSMLFHQIISCRKEKCLIVIENFPWLVRNTNSFMDSLVSFLKEEESSGKVMVILTGNTIGWIENTFVSKIGKNAFAISGFIKVKPLDFLELVCYFDKANTYSCLENYSVLGGIPSYWQYFDPKATLKENVCNQILRKGSYLYEEGINILYNELREASVYATILCTLAIGKEKLNEIHLHTGFSRAKISVYLKNLMELSLVEKVFSYETAGNENAQKGIYRISNPFIRFWFRYLYSNQSQLHQMSEEDFYDTFIAPDIKTYAGDYFRKVCAQYLEIMNDRKLLPFVYEKSGEWVGKAGTIDIVAQNSNRDTILSLCNFEKPMMTYEDYEWFLYCAKCARLRPEYCYLFSVGGFDEKLNLEAKIKKNIFLIDMNQL